MILLFAASFIGYCILYMALDLYDSSETPLVVCVQVILVSYFISLFGKINIIADILFYGGFAALIAGLFIKRKDLRSLLKKLASLAFIFFLVFCAGLYKLCRPVVCVYPDEIAHYGLLPKYLLAYDRIPGVNSVVELINYPPGTALLQYYTARFTGGGEGMVFFGQMLLYAALLTIVLKNVNWKKLWIGILSVALAIVVLFKFREYNFISLYTDQIAAMAGFFIAASYLRSEKKPKDILKLLPVVFFTPLIRESGVSYAVFGSAVILIDSLFIKNAAIEPGVKKSFAKWIQKNANVLSALLLTATAFLSYKIWNLKVDTYNIATYRGYLNFSNIIEGFRHFITTLFEVFNQSFQMSIVDSTGGWALITTPAGAALLFTITALSANILLKSIGRDDKGMRAVFLTIFAELIVYMVGLAAAYAYTFRPTEYLAALPRYMGGITVYCGLVITFLFSIALDKLEKGSLKLTIGRSIAIVLILMMFISTYPAKYNLITSRATSNGQQTEMDAKTAGIRSILKPDDKVYQVWQGTFDQTYYSATYSLMAETNTWGWSLGEYYYDGDVYTAFYTVEEWEAVLVDEGYDYVFIGISDERLWRIYGEMFSIVNDPGVCVYKVTPEGEYFLTAWDTEKNAPYSES